MELFYIELDILKSKKNLEIKRYSWISKVLNVLKYIKELSLRTIFDNKLHFAIYIKNNSQTLLILDIKNNE